MSRTVYERLSRALDDSRDELKRSMEYNRILVQTIVDMRREGFASAPKAEPRTEAATRRAGIEETIALVSGGNKQAATMTRAWVASQRASGRDDDEIQKDLLQPLPDEGEGVPV